ncbi:hypothetical protein K2173_009175 [Erythroxylum novogranatense]|uniref:Uncharacterized protein n=1 Tax=Erythroxylum novogranatense TaxID=1862640 RepID=A0AAV8TFL5_9ROSI|nr:hypothetical protein K2173_009175 [Erythroxylum novogranatense]
MAAASSSSKNLSSSSSCCSSLLGRPTNPNVRNSEASNPMRRSFTGTPFPKPSVIVCQKGGGFNPNTPANSPSDCPRRNFIGRENIIVSLRDHEDKENGKDHSWKSARGRSPASMKCSKNFMSPTISAASKISPSPRKKVLTDRNELIRSSMPSADRQVPSTEELDSKPEKVTNQKKEVSFDSTVTYFGEEEATNDDVQAQKSEEIGSKLRTITNDFNFTSEDVPLENDCVNLDPIFEISPRASCSLPSPALPPLDADPSVPLYDPKTNYPSPTPQFPHYKPYPRIELYLNKQIDGKRLDQNFLFVSLSDTETTEDETHSDVSNKESEDSCSGETLKEEKEKELALSEISSVSASVAKRPPKPRFFKTRKFFGLLFLTIACIMLSLTRNSQFIDSYLLNNLDCSELYYVPNEISEFTRKSLEDIVQQFPLQLSNLLSYGLKMIARFRERHKMGSLQYANLTSLLKDDSSDGYLIFDHGSLGAQIKNEEDSDIKLLEKDIEKIVGEDHQGSEEQEGSESEEAGNDIEEVSGDDLHEFEEQENFVGFEEQEVDNIAKVDLTEGRSEYTYDVDLSSAVLGDINSAPDVVEDATEAAYRVDVSNVLIDDIIPQSQFEMLEKAVNSAEAETILAEQSLEISHSSTTHQSQIGSEPLNWVLNRDISWAHVVAGVSFLALSLLAFIFMKNRISVTTEASAPPLMPPLSKKLNHCIMSASEFDIFGESSPSKMSSFQNAKKELAGTSEAQSYERRPRTTSSRESLASLDYSMGSSYGSFTTYEKIPLKNGNKEEEEFTPVRRSSRIRSQVTSP